MALSGLKVWTSGDVLTHTDLNANFNVVASKFGSLTSADLANNAAITTDQLANGWYEFLINLEVKPTTAVAPTASPTEPFCLVGLPGSATDGGIYRMLSANWVLKDSGNAAGVVTFAVNSYTISALGALTLNKALIGATDITSIANDSYVAGAYGGSPVDFNVLDATAPRFVGLLVTAIGVNALNTAYSSLTVTLKMLRKVGLRSYA